MDLNPDTVELGYKYPAQRLGDAPVEIISQADLDEAIATVQAMSRRAGCKIHILIHNLVCYAFSFKPVAVLK